jgi:dihydroflavonol-4-reductase
MKVLVTGGTGFLGSHLCRALVDEGHTVTVVRRSTSNTAALLDIDVRYELGDITDAVTMSRVVAGHDSVIHAAADISYSAASPRTTIDANVLGTANVARACRAAGVRRLVHVSSIAAIGLSPSRNKPADETCAFNLNHPALIYHISKHLAEEEVLKEVANGLNAVIVNPGWIFGPYGNQYRGADMMRKVRDGRIVPYFTGGLCSVHVRDVVDAIVCALHKGEMGRRYILGGENITFRELAARTAVAMQLKRRFVPVPSFVTAVAAAVLQPLAHWGRRPPWMTYARHYFSSRYAFYDSTRARLDLDFKPRGFDEILAECLRLRAC